MPSWRGCGSTALSELLRLPVCAGGGGSPMALWPGVMQSPSGSGASASSPWAGRWGRCLEEPRQVVGPPIGDRHGGPTAVRAGLRRQRRIVFSRLHIHLLRQPRPRMLPCRWTRLVQVRDEGNAGLARQENFDTRRMAGMPGKPATQAAAADQQSVTQTAESLVHSMGRWLSKRAVAGRHRLRNRGDRGATSPAVVAGNEAAAGSRAAGLSRTSRSSERGV